ncbi:threonylcarbamoyl-AMP synthase [Patescibacteria group bacterium]|nr:threonylcarbamoyl-AMP synthase [Patescibacteria group bacterium]
MKKRELSKSAESFIVNEAVKILKKGKIIVYPTETAYGLGADFSNPQALKKIYQIKGRSFKKPLSIIVSDFKMAKKLIKFDKFSLKLAKKYWPGPLTLVLEPTKVIEKFQQKGQLPQNSIALRISSNQLITKIVKKLGRPVTATSANFADQKECYTARKVLKSFKNKKYQPDLIIDAGVLPRRKTSTIVNVIDSQIKVLRKGTIKLNPKF